MNDIEEDSVSIEGMNKNKEIKNVKVLNRKEIELIEQFKGKGFIDEGKLEKYIEKDTKVNIEGNDRQLVENNAILIRPQILPSGKQIQYQNQINHDKEKYYYMLIRQLNKTEHGEINTNEVIDKLDKYKRFIHELRIKKFKEKLNLNGNNNTTKLHMLSINDKALTKKSTLSHRSEKSTEIKQFRKLSFYDKLWNCCCRSPLKPYSAKKIIWYGENGIFPKKFQDNRDYDY